MKKAIFISVIFFTVVIFIIILFKQPIVITKSLVDDFQISSISSDHTILKAHVKYLSEIDRSGVAGLNLTSKYIEDELVSYGIGKNRIMLQEFDITGKTYRNVIVSFNNTSEKSTDIPVYIVGAHYDAYNFLPGADDNASGVAGLLEIARVLNSLQMIDNRVINLVFYTTEEPPFFGTTNMGSYIHAESVKENREIKLAVILEMIGYYSEGKGSQSYPLSSMNLIYPDTGNYIMIASNMDNINYTRKVKSIFSSYLSKKKLITVESLNAPESIQGIDFSDHRNYWKFDIPAVMVTDTAFYRNLNYHTYKDTYEKLNYLKMEEVVNATIITVTSR